MITGTVSVFQGEVLSHLYTDRRGTQDLFIYYSKMYCIGV